MADLLSPMTRVRSCGRCATYCEFNPDVGTVRRLPALCSCLVIRGLAPTSVAGG